MPIPSPFHTRTAALMESHEWRDWSGYLAAALYEPLHDHEYYAIRSSAALIDVSPLFKYEIRGRDAERLVDRIITRDATKCAIGQVLYTPWCDDDGKVIDDGTITRLATNQFRITAADPNLAWFQDCAWGMEVEIKDVSSGMAALAIQGPNSRHILSQVLQDIDLRGLNYYRAAPARLGETPIYVSRTGYTGDLGYELWIAPEQALRLWDALMEQGEGYGLTPAGMLALDLTRIEAGLVMIQVDYISTRHALIEEQKSSPFEIGLSWAVNLKKGDFVGKKALEDEQRRGPDWQLVGVEVDWNSLEDIYAQFNLTPRLAGRASRQAVPVYSDVGQIGQMTSHSFSPLLKKYIGLASIKSQHANHGSRVSVEVTVEYTRQKAQATLVALPFYNPARKRA